MSATEWSGFLVENDQTEHSRCLQPFNRNGSPHRPSSPFRFLQASDLRLDTPCDGVVGLPSALRERLIESRYVAAERVFDAAIGYEVDFVVLAGGLLDAGSPGARGPCFLAGQFRRLAEHGIDVYWSGASYETRGRWPAQVDVPPNVHRLTADETGILHGRAGRPIARLLTIPAHGGTSKLANGAFTIAVQPRCEHAPEHFRPGVDYWALGGQSEHETVQVGNVVAHFAGSPQGRTPAEIGRHSCSLVQVDKDGGVKIHPVLTDAVRWHHQWTAMDEDIARSNLDGLFQNLMSQLPTNTGVDLHLVTWTISGAGPSVESLLDPRRCAELVDRLNADASDGSPAVWTLGIHPDVEPRLDCRATQQGTPLDVFLEELGDLSPHVLDLFGTVADGPHPLGAFGDDDDCQRLIARVAHEGVQRLATGDRLLQRAG